MKQSLQLAGVTASSLDDDTVGVRPSIAPLPAALEHQSRSEVRLRRWERQDSLAASGKAPIQEPGHSPSRLEGSNLQPDRQDVPAAAVALPQV